MNQHFLHGKLAEGKKENFDWSRPRRLRGSYWGGENSKLARI